MDIDSVRKARAVFFEIKENHKRQFNRYFERRGGEVPLDQHLQSENFIAKCDWAMDVLSDNLKKLENDLWET